MKSFLTTLTALAVALICWMAPSTMSAQNPDLCKPDCDTSEFGSTQKITLILPSGCVVRVDYAIRKACETFYDLGIAKIEVIGNCPISDPKSILDEVTEALLNENPMNFPLPDTNECLYSWRVVKGACWTWELDCDHDTVYVPCDSVACCLTPVEVCRDEFGTIKVTPLPGYTTAPCDSTLVGCEPVCGSEPSAAKGGGPGLS